MKRKMDANRVGNCTKCVNFNGPKLSCKKNECIRIVPGYEPQSARYYCSSFDECKTFIGGCNLPRRGPGVLWTAYHRDDEDTVIQFVAKDEAHAEKVAMSYFFVKDNNETIEVYNCEEFRPAKLFRIPNGKKIIIINRS